MINLNEYTIDNVDLLLEKIQKEEKIEAVVNDVLDTAVFQVIVCNKDKFDLKIENEFMKKVFENCKLL